jgi:hypothetical protein
MSYQIREITLIQPAKLPPFLKSPVMPELIRTPGSSTQSLNGWSRFPDVDHKRFESGTSDVIGDAPETIQEESCHTRFASRGACFLLFFAFKHAQDVSESDRNQERLDPLWIGYSGFFELECIASMPKR